MKTQGLFRKLYFGVFSAAAARGFNNINNITFKDGKFVKKGHIKILDMQRFSAASMAAAAAASIPDPYSMREVRSFNPWSQISNKCSSDLGVGEEKLEMNS